MNSILGMGELLKGSRLSLEQQQYLHNLLRSGNALMGMLTNLIDFSVLENRRLKLLVAKFDLFTLIDHCLHLVEDPAHHRNLNLYLNIHPDVPNRLRADQTRLEQILVNLLTNSIKIYGTWTHHPYGRTRKGRCAILVAKV